MTFPIAARLDFVSDRGIDYRAVIGILMMPWKLTDRFSAPYIFVWACGVFRFSRAKSRGDNDLDYYLVRRRQLVVEALYRPVPERTSTRTGFNGKALLGWPLVVAVALAGIADSCGALVV